MTDLQGQLDSERTGDLLPKTRRFLPTGMVPRSPLRRLTQFGLLVLSLSTLTLVVAEMPVSATAPGTASLTSHDSSFIPTSTVLRSASSSNVRDRLVSRNRLVSTSTKSSTITAATPTTTTTIAPTTTANTGTGTPSPTPTTTSTPAPTTTTSTIAPSAEQGIGNPTVNIAPSPNFLASGQCTETAGSWTCANPCVTSALKWPSFTDGVGCNNYLLQAIDGARADEGLAPMVLPTNWYSLSTDQQLFVVANLERTVRGLPPYLGINAVLSADAQQAAQTNADPSVASGFAIGNDAQGVPGMGGAWAGGFAVLAADYVWMYDDGWGGSAANTSNIACTSASASGCWAHRDELLGSDPGFNPGVGLNCTDCEVGTGFAIVNGSSSFVDLIEIPKGSPPAMTFTWAEELSQGG